MHGFNHNLWSGKLGQTSVRTYRTSCEEKYEAEGLVINDVLFLISWTINATGPLNSKLDTVDIDNRRRTKW